VFQQQYCSCVACQTSRGTQKVGTSKLPDTVMDGVKGVYRKKDIHRRFTSPVSSAASVCSAPQATLMTL